MYRDSLNCSRGGARMIKPYTPDCGPGYHWDFTLNQCVCNCCPEGYQWNGSQCVPVQPPPPPPPPAPDAQVPAGNITVSDVNPPTSMPGVRNVRIVAKRWFKIERGYTDNNGHFQFTKHFKHKVKIVVKFKNSYCNIRAIRGVRTWQTLYAVTKTIGVYSSNKNIIAYNFERRATNTRAKGNRYWVAATTNNAVQEHRDYATQFGFSLAPLGLNIYLTNWGITGGLSSTPLFGKRFFNNVPTSFVNTFLTGYVAFTMTAYNTYLLAITELTRARLDMAIDYHQGDMTRFTSDWVKEIIYHEMSHASHYTQAGNNWYTNFVSAVLAESEAHPSGQFNPYGNGTTGNSPIIALGEAWGYHMGHFLGDQRYSVNANEQAEQTDANGFGIFYYPNPPALTNHPHIDVLENYNPNLGTDPFHWIPKGLMLDLIDNGEPFSTTVNDNVNGYTIQQIFAALQSDINSLSQYEARLLQQNPTNPTNNQINTLFTSYGY